MVEAALRDRAVPRLRQRLRRGALGGGSDVLVKALMASEPVDPPFLTPDTSSGDTVTVRPAPGERGEARGASRR